MTVKRICVLLAGLALVSSVPAVAAPVATPAVAAVVNGEKITRDQFTSTLIDWQGPMTLDEIIDSTLVAQEAKKAGVIVTDAQVKARIAEMSKNVTQGQSFDELLKRSNMTIPHLTSRLKMRMQAEGVIRKSYKFTPEFLAGYRRAEHILVLMPQGIDKNDAAVVAAKDAEIKQKIDKIAAEIKGGLSFEDAVKKYSEDPSAKENGGDLGYFGKGVMTPEFEKAVFALKPGQISEPVKTPYGYHLIKLISAGDQVKGAEKTKLQETIISSEIELKIGEWFRDISSKAKVVNNIYPKPAPAPKAPAKK
jgi:foldase protein PrsA